MPCYHPLRAFQSRIPKSNGKHQIFFKDEYYKIGDKQIQLPCGQCIGCRIARSQQWAARCYHEASEHSNNCFITLTYDQEHLPHNESLQKKHFQDFMKRLRKKYTGTKIRFFHCGEYGEKLSRPHYHACLFGFDFPDKQLYTVRDQVPLYSSEILSKLWGKGFATIGAVTFESAAYVARYIMKKINGKDKEKHYAVINKETGEIQQRQPEYITMSRASGIGKPWYNKYKDELYVTDSVVIIENGKSREIKIPKFYDNIYEITDNEHFKYIKNLREEAALQVKDDNTTDRLLVKEKIKNYKLNKLSRDNFHAN